MLPTRRSLLTAFLAVPALPVCNRAAAQQPTLPLTPACRDDDDLTPALTAGPFYKPDAPLRHDLSGDAPDGERITIAGYVLDGNCRPIARSPSKSGMRTRPAPTIRAATGYVDTR